jgi:PKD repeat protein
VHGRLARLVVRTGWPGGGQLNKKYQPDCSSYLKSPGQLQPEQLISELGTGISEDGNVRSLPELYRDIANAAPSAETYVVGYPDVLPLPNEVNGDCVANVEFQDGSPVSALGAYDAVFTIHHSQMTWLIGLTQRLDAEIEQDALAAGDHYVDTFNAFDGHNVCDGSPQSWVNPVMLATESPLKISPYSVHPNASGQQALAQVVDPAIADQPTVSVTQGETVDSTLTVDADTSELAVQTQWPGSTIDLQLVSPSRIAYDGSTPGVEDVLSATSETLIVPQPEAGQWTVELYGAQVAPGGEPVTVTSTQIPESAFAPLAAIGVSGDSGVAPLNIQFSGDGSSAFDGASIASYEWNFGDGSPVVYGADTSHVFAAPGTYTVTLTVSDSNGQSDQATETVTVLAQTQPPTAGFLWAAQQPSAPADMSFDASVSSDVDSALTDYAWDFGDGTTGSGVGPQHSYASPGGYPVTLTVTDGNGLSDSVCEMVTTGEAIADPPQPCPSTSIDVAVTGAQVYGGSPVFTPGYSADPPGTAATISGTLTCSTPATPTSPVAGSPYVISDCTGLTSTAGPITYAYGALTVSPAPLTVSATPSSGTMTYGGSVPIVSPIYTGLVNGTSAPATPATCSTTVTPTSPVAGSPYATSCSGASDPNYSITYNNSATITLVHDPIAVTAAGTQVYGGRPMYTASYAGVAWVGSDGPSVVSGTLSCSTAATSSSKVSGNPYVISSCSGLNAANYAITYSNGSFTVTPAPTATTLTSSADPAVTGQPVTYTAIVTSTAGSLNPNTEGTVTFTSRGTTLCGQTVALTGNQASCTVTYPAVGSFQVTAAFSGDSNFGAGASTALTEAVVNQDATTTSLSASTATPLFGQSLTLTAAVTTKSPGSGTRTGTVTFLNGTTTLGTVALTSAGQASLTTNDLLPGTYPNLTASYSGDPNYLPSSSSAVQVTVGFSSCISGSHAGALTVSSGQAVCITGSVSGAVTVQTGGSLEINGGKVSGAVTMTQPTAAMLCAATISGPLSIQGATGPVVMGALSGCSGSTISGAVTLSQDAEGLQVDGATVSGAVAVTSPAAVQVCGDTISGAVSVKEATGLVTVGDPPSCAGNHISGAVTLSADTGGALFDGNTVGGAVSVSSNGSTSQPAASAPLIETNHIAGSLSCSGNDPAPSDGGAPNTVTGARSGQCGAGGF